MNGKKLLIGLSYIDRKFIDESENDIVSGKKLHISSNQKGRISMKRTMKRSLLIAAIIALMLLLMGCAAIVYLVLAESPFTSLPLLSGEQIAYSDIHIQVIGASPTGMAMMCTIENPAFSTENPEESEYAIDIINGPFYLERKTDGGWAELKKSIVDAAWEKQTFRTGGSLDLHYSWGTVYGYLDPGTYRITTTVVEGQPEVQVEFEIAAPKNMDNADAIEKCNDAVESLVNQEYYHIYLTQESKYGPQANGIHVGDDEFSCEEFWKSREDYLSLYSRDNGKVHDGSMKKDGIKYRLDNEVEGDSTTPVAGWSVWPSLDDNRLAWWAMYYHPDAVTFPEGIGVISDEEITFQLIPQEGDTNTETISFYFDMAGNLKKYQSVTVNTKVNGADVTGTYTTTIIIKDTDPADISLKIEEQDINFYRAFNWAADRRSKTPEAVTFQNTAPSTVTSAPEAIAQAMKECSVDYTKIVVYRDEAAGMWKVEFQILYGHQGYQYIYMNNDGITQMVAYGSAKY